MDAFTIGFSTSEADSETANSDTELTAYGISYAASDDLSVSLNMSEVQHELSTKSDQEAMGVSFSYTMGSLGIVGTVHDVDNIDNSSTNSREAYSLGSVSYTHLTLPTIYSV